MNTVEAPTTQPLEAGSQRLVAGQSEHPPQQQSLKVLGPGGLGLLGVCIYWMFSYSGPYRYLAELQLKWFGFYVPKLTIMVVFAGLIFGLWAIVKAIKFVFRGAERSVSTPGAVPIATPAAMHAAARAPALLARDRWLLSLRGVMLCVTPFIVFGLGADSYYKARNEGNLQHLTIADFESGRVTARSLFAEVHGQLSDSYISDDNYRYIPILSGKNTSDSVSLMVGISDSDVLKYLRRESDGTVTLRGIAEKDLSRDIRYAFEKNGIAVADPVWVMHAGRDPSSDRRTGLLIMGFGIALAVFVFGCQSYLKRKGAARLLPAKA